MSSFNNKEFLCSPYCVGNRNRYERSYCRSVSRATLAARFREEWNQTPAQYLTYIRLRQAANLLVTTGLSIAEVAHSVGYGDALYFSKVFAKVHNMSPTEYRRARQ